MAFPLRVGSGVLALLAAAAAAQAPERPPFTERVEVRVVNVDVFVTDRDGRPVAGLTRDSFRVFDDDAEVRLTHFRPPLARAGTETAAEAAPPAPDGPTLARDPLPVVLFLDNASLVERKRDRVMAELGRLARSSGVRMRFLVVSWDGELARWGRFSEDLGELERSLAEAGAAPARGLDPLVDYRLTLAGIRATMEGFGGTDCGPCQCGWDAMSGLWEGYARRAVARVEQRTAGLRELVGKLAPVPGRKAVVYLSAGLERRPGVSFATYLADLCPTPENILEFQTSRQLRYDESGALAELGAEAAAARVTLYSLQVASQQADPSLTTFARLEREQNLRDGLRLLADETGGRELGTAADLFEVLDADARSAYELAFEPAGEADGRVHRIRVELEPERPGVRLRHRPSYHARLGAP